MDLLLLNSDPLIALVILLSFTIAFLRGKLHANMYLLFWIGVFLGLCWELPLFLMGNNPEGIPPYKLLAPFPIHPQLQWISHSLWDGGLFMAGIALIKLSCPTPVFKKFSFRELGVFILFGIASALLLEVLGSFGIWEYIPNWWNPELFKVNGRSITALAPLTWMVVPTIFYLICLKLYPHAHDS
ncbi:MAG: hypothetical protein AAFY71_05085 [Bacteroidota bacterium]